MTLPYKLTILILIFHIGRIQVECNYIDVKALVAAIDEKADQVLKAKGNDSFRMSDEESIVNLEKLSHLWGIPKAIATLVTKTNLLEGNDTLQGEARLNSFREAFNLAVVRPCRNVRAKYAPYSRSLKRGVLLNLEYMIPEDVLTHLRGLVHCKEIIENMEASVSEGFSVFEKYNKPLFF